MDKYKRKYNEAMGDPVKQAYYLQKILGFKRELAPELEACDQSVLEDLDTPKPPEDAFDAFIELTQYRKEFTRYDMAKAVRSRIEAIDRREGIVPK